MRLEENTTNEDSSVFNNTADYANQKHKESFYGIYYKSFDSQICD